MQTTEEQIALERFQQGEEVDALAELNRLRFKKARAEYLAQIVLSRGKITRDDVIASNQEVVLHLIEAPARSGHVGNMRVIIGSATSNGAKIAITTALFLCWIALMQNGQLFAACLCGLIASGLYVVEKLWIRVVYDWDGVGSNAPI